MVWIIIFSVLVFMWYTNYITYRYGIQYSISQTYYTIGKKWWFTLVLWGFTLPALIVGMEVGGGPLMFLSAGAIMFVGAAPAFKVAKALETKVHMVGSYTGVFAGLLATAFEFKELGLAIIGLTIILLLNFAQKGKVKNKVWWIEVVAYYVVLFGITLKMLS